MNLIHFDAFPIRNSCTNKTGSQTAYVGVGSTHEDHKVPRTLLKKGSRSIIYDPFDTIHFYIIDNNSQNILYHTNFGAGLTPTCLVKVAYETIRGQEYWVVTHARAGGGVVDMVYFTSDEPFSFADPFGWDDMNEHYHRLDDASEQITGKKSKWISLSKGSLNQ